MTGTVTLPSGAKVRTRTNRDYILIIEGEFRGARAARIFRRSDSAAKLRAEARREAKHYYHSHTRGGQVEQL